MENGEIISTYLKDTNNPLRKYDNRLNHYNLTSLDEEIDLFFPKSFFDLDHVKIANKYSKTIDARDHIMSVKDINANVYTLKIVRFFQDADVILWFRNKTGTFIRIVCDKNLCIYDTDFKGFEFDTNDLEILIEMYIGVMRDCHTLIMKKGKS